MLPHEDVRTLWLLHEGELIATSVVPEEHEGIERHVEVGERPVGPELEVLVDDLLQGPNGVHVGVADHPVALQEQPLEIRWHGSAQESFRRDDLGCIDRLPKPCVREDFQH